MAHISLVTIGVADVARATRFYEAMGWQRSSASVEDTITFLRGGTIVLALFGRRELAEEAGIVTDTHAGSGPLTLATNLESESAVDRTLALAEQAGGRVTKPAARADWGGYSGYYCDPDGQLWEVAYNPGFPLLPDGRVQLPEDE
jgi:predicted lactoylglutathione lyase